MILYTSFDIKLPDNVKVKARVAEKTPVDVHVDVDLRKENLFTPE